LFHETLLTIKQTCGAVQKRELQICSCYEKEYPKQNEIAFLFLSRDLNRTFVIDRFLQQLLRINDRRPGFEAGKMLAIRIQGQLIVVKTCKSICLEALTDIKRMLTTMNEEVIPFSIKNFRIIL